MKSPFVLNTAILLFATVLAQAKVEPSSRFLQEAEGGCHCSESYPCSECELCDCDNNAQCSGNLVCYQRNGGDPVPGCPHISTGRTTDFCAPAPAPAPAPPTPAPTKGDTVVVVCFSGDTTVDTVSKGVVPMKELQVGDKIATGLNRYETVYAFAHYHPTRDTTFLRLQTSDSAELEITSEHLIYVEGKSNPVRASSVAVGDQLFPSGATVTKTSTVQKKGIYAPLTASGILLVNGGIQASNYASLIQDTDEYSYFQNGSPFLPQHDAIHLFLTPYRLACLSFATCDNAAYNEETGMPIFIDFGIRVLDWVNERSMHVQLILLGLAFPVFGLFWVLEKLLFGLGGFHLLFLCGVAVMVSKRSTKTKEL